MKRLFLLTGEGREKLDSDRLEIYYHHDPSGTSLQNIKHWLQMKSVESNLHIFNVFGKIFFISSFHKIYFAFKTL